MSKRMALIITVLGVLAAWTVMAEEASPASLNTLHDLFSRQQGGAMVVGVTGNYPILDYTYYDYDPETFVVDIADVDVSQLPKTLTVDKGSVGSVKVESISRNKGRALAKLEIRKAYLAKCLVSTEGNSLLVKVIGTAEQPAEPPPARAPETPSVSAVTPKAAAGASKLTGISVADDGSTVTLHADGSVEYQYFPMTNPDRIVVDLMGIGRGAVPNTLAGAGEVAKVRVSLMKEQPLVTRVVLDLRNKVAGWTVRAEGADVIVRLIHETF